MKDVILRVLREWNCSLEEIDISGQAELEARFGMEIPVLFINGRKAFKYRLTESQLCRRVATEARKRV
jgi:alkyl hydroperoxide reductase subunit AhpF